MLQNVHPFKTRSIHIVRRYGNVGGMERYVWELTHHLAAQGHEVMVICQRQYEDLAQRRYLYDIEVKALGETNRNLPRWLSMLIFSARVRREIDRINTDAWIIHSHERTGDHDISTFHGASIQARKRRLLDWLSPRLYAWAWMEKREVNGTQVRAVVPVSDLSRAQLIEFYPYITHLIEEPVLPAVSSNFSSICRLERGKKIGFIGKEWRRKGLDILVKSVARLRQIDSKIQLVVAGCEPEMVEHLFREWSDGYQLLGWVSPESVFREIDLLVLPSRSEPFGMVAAEANAAGLPVIVSDCCGIAPLIDERRGRVFSLGSPHSLDEACMEELKHNRVVEKLNLEWQWVARRYSEMYRRINKAKICATHKVRFARLTEISDNIIG